MSVASKIIAALDGFLRGDSYYVSTVCPNCRKLARIKVPKGTPLLRHDDFECPKCGVKLANPKLKT